MSDRLCIARGSWQVLTLAASLAAHDAATRSVRPRTTLVLSGFRLTPAIRNAMERLGRQLGRFDEVAWVDDLVNDLTDPTLSDDAFDARRAALDARLGMPAVCEVWTANPTVLQDRMVYEPYRKARLFAFEDGLATYSPRWGQPPPLRDRLRAVARYSKNLLTRALHTRADAFRSRTWKPAQPRISAAYLLLANQIGTPARYRSIARPVHPANLREAIDLLDLDVPPAVAPPDRPFALVLGGSASFWGVMSQDDEASLHADAIRQLDATGYQVWWKEHPRMAAPLLPTLCQMLPSIPIHAYATDHSLPLEVFLTRRPVDLIAASTSSSLLYAPLVCGERTRVATFSERFRPFLNGHRLDTLETIQAHVPSLDTVLCRPPTDSTRGTRS